MSEKKKFGAFNVVGIILCVILSIVLLNNIIIITKGVVNPDRPPSAFGFTTMIVMSGSMSGDAEDHIEVGDMIVAKTVNPSDLKVGDIISFMENETTAVTHRIIEILDDGSFRTKGDANNAEDQEPVKPEQIIGKFIFRIPKLGDAAMFMQTPVGMLIFIGIPIIIYFSLDTVLRVKSKKKKSVSDKENEDEKEAMRAEIERLRKKAGEGDATEKPEGESGSENAD